jgi:hypothetical protein
MVKILRKTSSVREPVDGVLDREKPWLSMTWLRCTLQDSLVEMKLINMTPGSLMEVGCRAQTG